MNRQNFMPLRQTPFWRYFFLASALGVVYFATAKIAFSILDLDVDPSPLWPPAGIALAYLLIKGWRLWSGVALGAFFFARSLGVSVTSACVLAFGAALQAVVGAQLLNQMGFRPSLQRLQDVLQLVILGVWVSPIVNATISTLNACLSQAVKPENLQENWLVLWLGDGMGILVITPLLLVLSQPLKRLKVGKLADYQGRKLVNFSNLSTFNPFNLQPSQSFFKQAEFIVCFTLLCAISWLVFGSKTGLEIGQYPLEYLPFPFVIWAALRFTQRGAVVATFVVCAIAIWGTVQGVGPFITKAENVAQAVLFLHGFMGVITITALVVAAVETQRVLAVELLQEREGSLANAQRLAKLGNWDFYETRPGKSVRQQQLRWSDELYRLFGFTPKAFEPSWEAFFQVVHPADRERVGQAIRDALRENQPYCLDYRILLPDGSERVVHEQSEINECGISGTVQDITDRKQVEAQLRAAVDRVREAAERQRLLGEMALRIRRSLNLAQILNTTVEEVRQFLGADRVFLGQIELNVGVLERPNPPSNLSTCQPANLPTCQSATCQPTTYLRGLVIAESVDPAYPSLRNMVLDDRATLQEWRSLFAQGRVVTVEDTSAIAASSQIVAYHCQYQVKAVLGVPIWLGDELYGALVINQCSSPRQWQSWEIDWLTSLATQVAIAIQQAELYRQITELNTHLESQVEERTQELSAKMAELQELNHLKDVFLQAVSHDLRTSLLGMSMVFNNLYQSPGETVTLSRPLLKRMMASNERQLNLINSLLEDHFNEVRQLELHCEPLRLDQLIQDLIADYSPMLAQNQATLTQKISADLPAIAADPIQLRRVLENLLTNALKHNPPGLHLTLHVTVEGDKIRCILQDNGVGMSQQQQNCLFKLYIRGLHTEHLTGIGLGLYQCRQIISAHGGQIGVASAPDAGATFWFTLPVAGATVVNCNRLPSKKDICIS